MEIQLPKLTDQARSQFGSYEAVKILCQSKTYRNFYETLRTFVGIKPTLDMTTPSGRALGGMLLVFAAFERDILRDRVKAGIAQARKEGRPHGRPATVTRYTGEISVLFAGGTSKRQIAAKLGISRSSVR